MNSEAESIALVTHLYHVDYDPCCGRGRGPNVLARRIARARDWSKTGSRIFDRVMSVTKQHFQLVADSENHFVWQQKANPSHCPTFRRLDRNIIRPIDVIALPESIALAREILTDGYEGDEALSAMAKLAGLQKLRQASRERLGLALNWS